MSANPAPTTPAFIHPAGAALPTPLGVAINRRFLADEADCVRELVELARLDPSTTVEVRKLSIALVDAVRANRTSKGGLDAFLRQYDLASREGVILMCLAEALLRIPDSATADDFIADQISGGAWEKHLGASDSLFVNASTWGLMLTGRVIQVETATLPSALPA